MKKPIKPYLIPVFVLTISGIALISMNFGRAALSEMDAALTGQSAIESQEINPPGHTEETGMHFEIKDSSYLNITLDSSETIRLRMESVPEMVTMLIEPVSAAESAQITLSGFNPLTRYFKYEDNYHNLTVFTTDPAGSYSYTQDIEEPHFVFIQPRAGTIYIKDNPTGGDCESIGRWNDRFKICTLETDVYETIQMDSDSITLDGNQHGVYGYNTGFGIFLSGRKNVRIENLRINNFSTGIFLIYSNDNIVSTNTVSYNRGNGINLFYSNNNSIDSNTISHNGGDGIDVFYSNNNRFSGNEMFKNFRGIFLYGSDSAGTDNSLINNSVFDNFAGVLIFYTPKTFMSGNVIKENKYNFQLSGYTDAHFNNTIDITNLIEGKPFYYVKDAVGQTYDASTNAGTFYCINCRNVTIKDLNLTKNTSGLLLHKTSDSRIENITASNNNYFGIALYYSNNNEIVNNTATLNERNIILNYSNGNTLSGNEVTNSNLGILIGSSSNNNILFGNRIALNNKGADYGGLVVGSDNTQIYNNNFIDNYPRQISAGGIGNVFSKPLPIGGNYWSDYDTPEEGCFNANNDSFCDNPYVFQYGQDDYPWVREDGWSPQQTVVNVAVILAEPSDKDFDSLHDKAYFENEIIPKVKDYYCEVSFGKRDTEGICSGGKVNLNFDVFDNDGQNYELPQNQQDYGENQPQIINFDFNQDGVVDAIDRDKTEEFVWDAINAADADINYNSYESTMVIYAGSAEGGLACLFNDCLSTQYQSILLAPRVSQNEYSKNWISVSEDEGNYDWAHEIAHALGEILTNKPLYDLYKEALPCGKCDYGGDIVDLDVLGAPNLLDYLQGTPKLTNLSSFSKIKLNWLDEESIDYGLYEIESLETMKFGDKVKKYNLPSNSYYLLEARTNNPEYSKWDKQLADDALVIYRVKPKEILINNQSRIISFINVVKSIWPFSLDSSFKDPVNDVKIEASNFVAYPANFKIDTQVAQLNPFDYIGAVLTPELSLLGEVWNFVLNTPLRRIAGDSPRPSFLRSIWLDAKDDPLIILLLTVSLILLGMQFITKSKIKITKDRLKIIKLKERNRILTWIIVFTFLTLIIRALLTFGIAKAESDLPTSLATNSSLDLDLHAITPDGKHTGVNYATGGYENQIPDAIASGDLVYDDEWIFVPEGTDVKYYVSSKDIQKFLEENPDTASELPSAQETYGISAMYYDVNSNKFTSEPRLNQIISPNQNVIYQISGTTDISVSPGILDDVSPVTNVLLSGNQGENNWYISDVEVSLTAEDDENGIGVSKTEYSLDNGQTWSQYDSPFTISEEEIHTVFYRSQDFLGNLEETKNQVIKIDKTPPEAKVYFDKNSQSLKIEGIDNLFQTETVQTKDAFIISDESGHTLKLAFRELKQHGKEIKADLESLQYDNGQIIPVQNAEFKYEWSLNKDRGVKELEQRLDVKNQFEIKAKYNHQKDETEIEITRANNEKVKQTLSGLIIIKLTTRLGVAGFEF